MNHGPLNPDQLVLHDAQIVSISFERAENTIVLLVERHSHWVSGTTEDQFPGAARLWLRFSGIYDFDFDLGSAVIGLTIDRLQQEQDLEASTTFPVWKWSISLQEGLIEIRATDAVATPA